MNRSANPHANMFLVVDEIPPSLLPPPVLVISSPRRLLEILLFCLAALDPMVLLRPSAIRVFIVFSLPLLRCRTPEIFPLEIEQNYSEIKDVL